jgi:DNA-binding NarL/FixJ family response regulator
LRLLVVSALPAVRAGLRALLDRAADLSVVGEADRLPPAAALDFDPPLDLVVVDLGAGEPLADWLTAEERPGLLLIGQPGPAVIAAARSAARAWGALPATAEPGGLIAAAQAVGSGLIAVDPALADELFGPARPVPELLAGPDESLSPREREVLQLIALGLPNKLIATRLNISEHTVKFHVASILTRLGAASRTEAVHLGAQRGLVTL